ncbi:MAG: FadR/GntR family transcriptional regulator, partial [Microbacteriaceae bacterium]
MTVKKSTFTRTLDQIGSAVCTGLHPEGTVITVEQLVAMTGASRSIVREATRVLAAAGLVEARQRIGMRVLPPSRWNALDPRVIMWRLASGDRANQIDDLFDLRIAIEPSAARLAAARRTEEDVALLLETALALRAAAEHGDTHGFLKNDAAFHRTILEASGNSAFQHLTSVIEAALVDRETRVREGEPYDPVAVDLHLNVARQVEAGEGAQAEESMQQIIQRTRATGPGGIRN